MRVEYGVESDHFKLNDAAFPEAIDKYTSPFWPFGRKARAKEKLEDKQEELLEKFDIIKKSRLGITKLIVKDVEDEEEANQIMEDFKEEIDDLYREEFGVEEPFKYSVKERVSV